MLRRRYSTSTLRAYFVWGFLAACALCERAPAQTLLNDIDTIASNASGVPIVENFQVATAGTYVVTLTDLGATLVQTATQPLASAPLATSPPLSLAVTQGTTVVAATSVGTNANNTESVTFAATPGTYTIRVTGAPGPNPGSGPIGLQVTGGATNSVIYSSNAALIPPQTPVGATEKDINTTFSVPSSGNYLVSLSDLQLPAALGTLYLAIIEPSCSSPVDGVPIPTLCATITSVNGAPASTTVALDPTKTYQLFVQGIVANGAAGALYGVNISAAGQAGSLVYAQTVPIGAVQSLGSVTLTAAAQTLVLTDLGFPAALSLLSAELVQNGQPGSTVATAGSTLITPLLGAGSYALFALAVPGASGSGSFSASVGPPGGAAALSAVNVASTPTATSAAFVVSGEVATAGSYQLRLADFQIPAALSTVAAALVQGGAIVGTPLGAAGSMPAATLTTGTAYAIVVATSTSPGGLVGVDLTPTTGSGNVFAATQGVGAAFMATPLAITAAGNYAVTVDDLGFPARFASLNVVITQGTTSVVSFFGGGTFLLTNAAVGNYAINVLATPNATAQAGTYSVNVVAAPAPTVTFSASAMEVASGGTVTLTWSSTNATACSASGGWSGALATSGSQASLAVTAATTYTLTCTGTGGSTPESVTVALAPASHGGGAVDSLFIVVLSIALLLLARTRIHAGARNHSVASEHRRHYAAMLAVGVVVVLGLNACGGAKSRFESHLQRGKQYSAALDWQKANVEFRNALQIDPKSAEALFLDGVANEKLGNVRGAIGAYQASVDAQPTDPAPRAALGRIFMLAGAADRALEVIQPVLEQHPNDAKLLLVRAGVRSEQNDLPAAIADAELAVRTEPTDEDGIALLAGLYNRAGDQAKSIDLLNSAITSSPQTVALRLILANEYVATGNPEKAEPLLLKVIELRPDELSRRGELARFYAQQNRKDDGERVVVDAVRALPTSDEAKLLLASYRWSERTHALAEQTLRDFIAKQPQALDLQIGLADFLQRDGSVPAAIEVYRGIIERAPRDPRSLVAKDQIAQLEVARGHDDVALKTVGEVLQKNPRDYDALTLRANLELKAKNPAAAIADLRSVLRDQPNSLALQRTLARAQVENNEMALAEETLRGAVEAAPRDVGAHLDLGRLLLQRRHFPEAVQMFEETVRMAPDVPEAREALTRAYLAKGDMEAARTSAADLKTLRPDSYDGFYLAGLAAAGQKRLDDAQRELERAREIQPKALDALAELTRVDVAQGRTRTAIDLVRTQLSAQPKNAFVANLLGELELGSTDYTGAVEALNLAIELDPAWATPRRNLALARLANGDPKGAAAAYEAAVQIAPSDPWLIRELARLYERENRVDDAIALYQTLYKKDARYRPFAASNMAMLLVTYRQDRPSLERAGQLTADFASSNNAVLLDANGWVRFKQGAVQEALPVLERALEREPESSMIRYHVALAELQTGERDRARANLETALGSKTLFDGADDARSVLASLKRGAI